MKTRILAAIAVLFASAGLISAATNDLTTLIQKGLFEEEASHDLDAAIRDYQAAVDGFDQDRQLHATAVFRLGECWRKLGKTNEANAQYQRILREFPDQTNLTKLCSEYLGGAKANIPFEAASGTETQDIQSAYNSLKVKMALADSELAVTTNLNPEHLENYFTTVQPDSTLLAMLGEITKAETAFDEAERSRAGAKTPALDLAREQVDDLERRVESRAYELLSRLQLESQMLHAQCDALQKLLNQSSPSAPLVAANVPADGSSTSSAEDEEVLKIKEMIRNSPDLINAPGIAGGMTPLQEAIRHGNLTAVQLLLANGVDTTATSRGDGATPLCIAADTGNKAAIELLLAKGADINATDKTGAERTPLHHAAARGFKTVVECLLAHKASVNARDISGSTPLFEAAVNGYRSVAELLIANHADANAQDKQGRTPLFEAVVHEQAEMVQLLLTNNAEVNLADNQDETPLFAAAEKNLPKTAELLLAGKADANAAVKSGVTPLLVAVSRHNVDIGLVKILLMNGADPQAQPKESDNSWTGNMADKENIPAGCHAVDLAIRTGRTDVLELLLTSHADPNATSPRNEVFSANNQPLSFTPLLLAVTYNNPIHDEQSFKILLAHGANPDLADEMGRTPLINAVLTANTAMVQELLDHHADVNKPDKDGKPPLAFVPDENTGLGRARPMRFGGGGGQQNFAAIKALLLKAGANEDYQRLGRVFVTQKGTGSIGTPVFSQDANSVNHYTLLELIAEVYQYANPTVPFPDFAHVVINRLDTNSVKKEINVNAQEILSSGDCSKDIPLEWGDVVQIPQQDHPINQNWQGFQPNDPVPQELKKCLQRQVQIIVKGQAATFTLIPRVAHFFGSSGLADGVAPPGTLYTFSLNTVVHQANVLLLSSDLTRVKVTRNGVPMQYSLESSASDVPGISQMLNMGGGGFGGGGGFHGNPAASSDLWLRDGDVIEIPERDPGSAIAK